MAPPQPRQPPELMVELVEDILLHVPPDDPACLARASLVCKPWRRLLSNSAFSRRYRAFHRAPPLLGFLHEHIVAWVGNVPRFVPAITPYPFPQRTFDDCAGWRVLDCRHGHVLFESSVGKLVVWDPTTGKRQRLPEPPVELGAYNAAVLCAMRGCDHLDCRGGPFFVVLVGYNQSLWSHMYSSEAGAWISSSHLGHGLYYFAKRIPSLLIGDDVYFVIIPRDTILKYNLERNCLSIIHPPEEHDTDGGIALMPMADASLGIASVVQRSKLCLWSRNAEVVSGWEQFRVIELEPKTPIPFRYSSSIKVVGSAEGFGIIFVTTDIGAFTLELKTGQVRKVAKPPLLLSTIFPFMSFYTPDCCQQQLPSPAAAH